MIYDIWSFVIEEKGPHYEVANESDPEQRHGQVELQVLKKPAHTVQTNLQDILLLFRVQCQGYKS